MLKYNIYFIILLFGFYLNVYAIYSNSSYETIKIDDVLQSKVRSCQYNNDCKNYGGNCNSVNNIAMVEDIKVNGLILESCTNDSFKNKNCITLICGKNEFEICKKDDECYYRTCTEDKIFVEYGKLNSLSNILHG
ncbi:hypothetical protein PIROE2DRAFT_5462 [Piromyces sp. E2]|nr:hypothetical protein PIROE2DRAFT_5462 [Piromyces sp. E2]|eukprot:OUM67194.1 hypothetical protein PIROE2DRAFT_5462 [Piromyces sp. E2]